LQFGSKGVSCGWYNLRHDPVCIAKTTHIGQNLKICWKKTQAGIGTKRAGIGPNRFFCGAGKRSIWKINLLQTRTRETVDCVASHHNIGYQTTWAKTPGKKKKQVGQNQLQR
jgi:hypothetical protein